MESYNPLSLKKSIFFLIFIFVLYLITRIPSLIIIILFMLPYIVGIIFRTRGYSYKRFYQIISIVLLIQGLTLVYMYIFRSLYLTNLGAYLIFYFFSGGFIMLIVYYTHHYLHRNENKIIS